MEKQELFMRMQMMEQEAEKIKEHLQSIEQQTAELNSLRESISSLIDSNLKNKEILANLGKGIFVQAQITGNELIVNVGHNSLVKKTPQETLKIIEEQLAKLEIGKIEFSARLENIQEEMKDMINNLKGEHSCCQENCECEEDCGENCKCK